MGLWSKKSIERCYQDAEGWPYNLQRTLSSGQLVLMGIGAIIGAGLFSITGVAAAQNAGPAILISFLLAAIGCAFAGLCYSEIASMIPVSGSAYTYAYATLGEFIAWIIGWDLILEYAIGTSCVAISWSAYLVSFLYDLGIFLPPQFLASPWQPVLLPDGTNVYGIINLPAFLIVALSSAVLILGVNKSALVNALLVILKLCVVVIFVALGYSYINQENYHPFIPENTGVFGEFGWSGILRGAGVVFFAYIGFDAVSTMAQETKNPQRAVPVGILGSLCICTILYIVFAYVLTGMVNYQDLNNPAPVALAIAQTPYVWLNGLVKLAVLCGLTSVMLVMLLGQSRIFYCMARDGLLPRQWSKIHPRFRTPWLSNLILLFFVGAFGAFSPIALVGEMTSIGTLLAFVLVCIGVMILRKKQPHVHRSFKLPLYPLTPLLGIAVCLAMMLGLGVDNWLRLLFWLAIGMVIYFGYGKKNSIYKDRPKSR